MNDSRADITRLLRASASGDPRDGERLMVAIYDDLRRLAASQLQAERASHTLNATALAHEAYIRLVEQHTSDWNDRVHFFAVAARIIRRILVDHARHRHALKRGGPRQPISLEEVDPAAPGRDVDLMALDEALNDLAQLSERQARIVELRYFGGMTIPEIAAALGIASRSVDREWQGARAWLLHRLSSDEVGPGNGASE